MILPAILNKIINRAMTILKKSAPGSENEIMIFEQKRTQFFVKKIEFFLFLILYVTISI